jgi:hypothetical protein
MMNKKVKSSLIIIIVLLIGMAIGFEISEISIRHHFNRIDAFREPRGFIQMFEHIIKPTEVQKAAVDSILTKYHTQMERITKNGMEEVSAQMNLMQSDLIKILDKEQSVRLDEELSRMKREPPPPPRGRGPRPPEGDRPPPPRE